MCDICHRTICPSRCPNADEPPVFAECDICGYEIYVGDEYYEVEDLKVCENCIFDSRKTAEVD